MNCHFLQSALVILMMVFVSPTFAETVYVTNSLQIGLHADKITDSPIIKVVRSGTSLEVIKSEDKITYVRTAEGQEGWIDNSYLLQNKPSATTTASSADGTQDQQLKTEMVKNGELQVEVAELRKRLGQNLNNDSLYEKIDQLTVEKKQLEVQMAQIFEGAGQPVVELPGNSDSNEGHYTLTYLLLAFAVALIAGIIAGLYLMDWMYRRRHGGFRV